jgi:glycosyltransferase involved in cell wall biosynthesis
MLKASLIISFYNKVDYLKLVLAGLVNQTFKDFEVIIADDGSSHEVVEEIENISKEISFPLIHIWHEDNGWQKNKILNQAIRTASSNYLIFIDGDCVPHSEFVKEHYTNRKENVCLTGRRVNLSKRISDKLTVDKIKNGFLENSLGRLLLDGIFGESFDVEKGLYVKSNWLRNYFNKKRRGILGCNFSIYKEELIEINGFDERYRGPSIGEDSDIQFRLELNGVKIKSLNNIAIQYHLYHKIQPRPKENLDLFAKIKTERISATNYGLK